MTNNLCQVSLLRLLSFLILLSIQRGPIFCSGQHVHVYRDDWHQGINATLSISNCTNIPWSLKSSFEGSFISAINTQGHCARLYDAPDCQGNSIEIMPHSPSHGFLHAWGFDDKAMSVGKCQHSCSVEVTGPLPPKEGLNVTIYSGTQKQGYSKDLNIRGCTVVPAIFESVVLSVDTSSAGDNCFELYNNTECNTNSSGAEYNSVELRPNTPHHNYISQWNIKRVRAISHCSFKCSSTLIAAVNETARVKDNQNFTVSINVVAETNVTSSATELPKMVPLEKDNIKSSSQISSSSSSHWPTILVAVLGLTAVGGVVGVLIVKKLRNPSMAFRDALPFWGRQQTTPGDYDSFL